MFASWEVTGLWFSGWFGIWTLQYGAGLRVSGSRGKLTVTRAIDPEVADIILNIFMNVTSHSCSLSVTYFRDRYLGRVSRTVVTC